jgi:pyruvate/2-oxoglutarate dehydrogenase complex dihydrolipoamide acyltransferase (E2) component
VLDALSADEMIAVRSHLASCGDAHVEIDELAAVLPVLGESVPVVEPPAALKGRIMEAAAADLEEWRGAAAVAPAQPAPTEATPLQSQPAPAQEPIPLRPAARTGASPATWALRIAAVLAIALLGGWNLLLQGQLNQARSYQDSVAAVTDAAAQPGALTAVLTPEGGSGPSGLAAVESDGSVTLAMQSLGPTTGDEVYEAWVIAGDGVPVPLGGFQVGAGGTAFFEATGVPAEAGVVLALTREPGPGATTPTLPIVSSGAAG